MKISGFTGTNLRVEMAGGTLRGGVSDLFQLQNPCKSSLSSFAVDYNSWQESEQGLKLAASLDKDVVLAEGMIHPDEGDTYSQNFPLIWFAGYKEYQTGRRYMAKEGDWRWDKDVEWELDGIGGVNILVKADVHRSGGYIFGDFQRANTDLTTSPSPGINFPCYAFENQAETEGFAKMAKRAGYGVWGLPNYIVWHIDTEEKPGNA